MKVYAVVFAPTAVKQIRKIDKTVARKILAAIAQLANDPFAGKQLKGEFKAYRCYRVGDWRVIYCIQHQTIQIEVVRVAHRREVYRN